MKFKNVGILTESKTFYFHENAKCYVKNTIFTWQWRHSLHNNHHSLCISCWRSIPISFRCPKTAYSIISYEQLLSNVTFVGFFLLVYIVQLHLISLQLWWYSVHAALITHVHCFMLCYLRMFNLMSYTLIIKQIYCIEGAIKRQPTTIHLHVFMLLKQSFSWHIRVVVYVSARAARWWRCGPVS